MQKRIVFVLLGLCLAAFLSAQDVTSDSKQVIATGMGSVIGGDVSHARDDAIDDALRRALEQAVGLLVEAETLVENFQLVEDNIYSKTRGYVKNYDVIRESQKGEALYEVTLRATVKMADLESDLEAIEALWRRKNMPRIMIMVDEKNIGETPGYNHYIEADLNNTETALMNEMMPKGFKFIDRATIKQAINREKAAAILEGNISLAASVGQQVGAEIVITGTAIAKATEVEVYGTKQRSQQATVNVKVIRTDTGDIIATASGQGAYPHIDDMVGGTKAIQKACKKITDDLIPQILERWQSDVSSGTTITLNVRGVSDFALLSKFKNSLKYYVRGVESVNQRDWYEGFAKLELVLKGDSESLATHLSNKEMEGIFVKVIGMTQNSVTVEITQK